MGGSAPASGEKDGEDEGGDGEDEDVVAAEPRNEELLKKGEGEEDDTVLSEWRAKIFQLKDKDWKNLGIHIFKLNKSNSTGKVRIICRMEGSGKATINTFLKSTMTSISSADGKCVSVVVFQKEGPPVKFLARVKTAEEGKSLLDACEKNR